MEVTDQNIQTLSTYLRQTLSPNHEERRPAEKFLESVEANKHYPLLLLHILSQESTEMVLRVSAAITFKNYIKRNWKVSEDGTDRIHVEDRHTIKTLIVELMLKSPEQIQRQLSDAISVIGREDFPGKWPNLLQEMVDKFRLGDFHIINGVLQTAHSIFKRYRHEFKSEELWKEIKFVLDNFAAPFTALFKETVDLAEKHSADVNALKVIFSSLSVMCKIFYSLNYQDLPEHFEDNMEVWMSHFHTLLTVDNKLLRTEDDEEAGLLEILRSQICNNITMYAQKYDDEFSPYLPKFVDVVWHLLINTSSTVKYDLLVSNAIQFLSTVADRSQYKGLFEDTNTLTSICEKVVVPNMQFRDIDEEIFEDNPEEYIRRDIEGSDFDTRRRSASDLVKSLCRHFEASVVQIFAHYMEVLLKQYSQNPKQNWKSKDTAIYLVTSVAAKAQTAKHGITQTSGVVNISDFLNTHILPELVSADINDNAVLKSDCIKYVSVFRTQLPKPVMVSTIPVLVQHLSATSVVQHSYAAHTLERIFVLKNELGKPTIVASDIPAAVRETMLTNLFNALTLSGSMENEYIMKCMMRALSMLQEQITPYIPLILERLTGKLVAVSKNPSKPHFNHYLFECLSLSVRITCKASPGNLAIFEQHLFPPFQVILQQDVSEFIPYTFQILSLLLELHPVPVPAVGPAGGGGSGDSLPDSYMALFPLLLTPMLWERPGNVPALTRLLQAYVSKGATAIGRTDKVKSMLGVFQKLIASKTNDHEGFYLLQSMIEHMNTDHIMPYMKQVFLLLFQRFQSSKTTKFSKCFIVFTNVFVIKFGAPALVETIDGIQNNMFGMVVEKIVVTDLQKISDPVDKKICAVGIIRLLTDCPPLLTGQYSAMWASLLTALIGLFELPEDESRGVEDEHFVEIEDTPGHSASYQTVFSQLAFAGRREQHESLVAGVGAGVKLLLATSLQRVGQRSPGLLPKLMTGVPSDAATYLQAYLQSAGVTLV